MAKLVVMALLAAVAFSLWRNWSRQRRAGYIDRYPYARFLDQRLAARRPDLSAAQRAEVLAGLADYFHLCRTAGRRMVAMPSQAVDDAWHEFILFTRQYHTFCRHAFGRFLHHTPAEAMASPTQATDGIRRAWRLACLREKINPKQPARLPRLFALDAKLGIAGGFIYHLDCQARSPGTVSNAGGNSFCASHIGCGGTGCSGGCGGSTGSSDAGGEGGCSGGGGCGGGGD